MDLSAGWLPGAVELPGGVRVLESPCGRGRWIKGVVERFEARGAIAVDPIPANLAEARQTAAETGLEITFILGSASDLPFADGTFDWVLSAGALERCAHVDATLHELTRLLAPEGRAVLVWEDSDDSLRERPRRRVRRTDVEPWCRQLGLRVFDGGETWASIGR